MKLTFATGNAHKALEVEQILRLRLPQAKVQTFSGESPQETGTSFLENALIKARSVYQATGEMAFADDSGLCVDVMGGSPGIFSAIWSGTRDDRVNRDLLLAQLVDIAPENRQASFVCTVALVGPEVEVSFTGVWPGAIALESRGEGGFGYDPIFIPEGFVQTAAELPAEIKNSMSHRYLAMSQLADYLASS